MAYMHGFRKISVIHYLLNFDLNHTLNHTIMCCRGMDDVADEDTDGGFIAAHLNGFAEPYIGPLLGIRGWNTSRYIAQRAYRFM